MLQRLGVDIAQCAVLARTGAERVARADVSRVRRDHRSDNRRTDPGHRPGQHGAQLGWLPVAAGRRHPRPAVHGKAIVGDRAWVDIGSTEELSRSSVDDLNIEAHSGFIAIG